MFSKVVRAFTLIELLIVVAIIAILAAIAVPNFLEAQMRSKVSRAKADMRTFATAVEAKAVDKNGRYNFTRSSRWISPNLKSLTTPISYITSLPQDPFMHSQMLGYTGTSDPIWEEKEDGTYTNSGTAVTTPNYVYQWYDNSLPGAGTPEAAGKPWYEVNPHPDFPIYYSDPSSIWFPSFKLCVEKLSNRQWFLISQGPAFLKAGNNYTPSRSVDWKQHPYDTTNGTVSAGLVVRVGP